MNYYKLADMGTYLQSIDEWMRRRIRMVFWKKWKRVRTRWRNLLKLGISNRNAGILANSRKGYWRIASSPTLQTALSSQRLERAGFQFCYSYYRKSVAAQTREEPCTRPVRTVLWEVGWLNSGQPPTRLQGFRNQGFHSSLWGMVVFHYSTFINRFGYHHCNAFAIQISAI